MSEAAEPGRAIEDSADDALVAEHVATLVDAVAHRVAEQRLPGATYRLQLHGDFTFRDAAEIVPYLADLGVSDLYLSPCVRASKGSRHGYDIVDHGVLNPEIGTPADYERLTAELAARGMGLIFDVVPNHMGVADSNNGWWFDVLENGPSSIYAGHFDIDWMPLKPDLANKVLLPVLGDQYGRVLENGELRLQFEEGSFALAYYDRRFPLAPDTWDDILRLRGDALEALLEAAHLDEYHSILNAIAHLPSRSEPSAESSATRRREKEVVRRRLNELCQAAPDFGEFLAENVRLFNGTAGDPRSFDLLDALLLRQAYRLADWRVAADEINYRRFFDVNDLAAIRMEDPVVFDDTHRLLFELTAAGCVIGFRIDHPDGLYDPPGYSRRLQRTRFLQLCREAWSDLSRERNLTDWELLEPALAARFEELARAQPHAPLARPFFVVVEKILEPGESLPANWPTHGTTGYDFLASVNNLFVDSANAAKIDAVYAKFIEAPVPYKELVYRSKKLTMQASMSSELSLLGHQLDRISERDRRYRDFTLNSLTDALREVIACFPVYRTYVTGEETLDRDRRYIERAVVRAKRRNRSTSSSIFDLVRRILLLEGVESDSEEDREAKQKFVGRFQQLTGPVMAKSVEDTAYYNFNRLVSLNEVGGDPEHFGESPAGFHQHNMQRQARWPCSLLATSTHDTKRSEDVRARINALSEMPTELRTSLNRWSRLNQSKKVLVDGEPAPSRNDEYLLYQTLLGTWPLCQAPGERPAYIERMQEYMRKAVREAKAHSSWIDPNNDYERGMCDFIAAILMDSRSSRFLPSFDEFARKLAEAGFWTSLSQVVLKLTAPGVPDFYQGTELWDFSLVDPDNRRPVDYALRQKVAAELGERLADPNADRGALAQELLASAADGRIKLYVISLLLALRHERPELFTTGDYTPLDFSGVAASHLCGFSRRDAGQEVLVVVPRLIISLMQSSRPPLGRAAWGDTAIALPADFEERPWINLFTGERVVPTTETNPQGERRTIAAAADVFAGFPVAVLQQTASEA